VQLTDGATVRIAVVGAEVEPDFEALRLAATVSVGGAGAVEPAGDFAAGSNDVVLFSGATWIEQPPPAAAGPMEPGRVLQFTGHPGQTSASAAAVCLTTDAAVVATATGVGLLVRLALRPYAREVVRDPIALAAFLRERGYGGG
jgi:hypothetical protein